MASSFTFLGRLLANQNGITLWEDHQQRGYILHLVERGIALELNADAAADLLAVLESGLARAAQPEDEKDTERRLQILRARVSDFIRNELGARRGAAGAPSGDRDTAPGG